MALTKDDNVRYALTHYDHQIESVHPSARAEVGAVMAGGEPDEAEAVVLAVRP